MRLIDAEYAKEHMSACELNGRPLHCMELEERLAVIDEVPTVDAIPVVWIKEWVEEIKDHPAYTEEEKTLCIEEFEDMLGAWAERKDE